MLLHGLLVIVFIGRANNPMRASMCENAMVQQETSPNLKVSPATFSEDPIREKLED